MSTLMLAYLATLALHAGFVAYVVVGTAYALVQAVRRADDPFAEEVRSRLPFMLGCGITAGVAPLLFLQLLYQRRFYTANLLLGPRWIAIVPALIAGFYALYLAKATARARWRTASLAVGVVCFAFVAYSWSEQHALMQDSAAWTAMYAAGERIYIAGEIPLRFALFTGAMMTLFAMVAAWSTTTHRRRLGVIALVGRALSVVAALALGGEPSPWVYALATAAATDSLAWLVVVRRPDDVRALYLATAAGVAALAAAVVVRELPRMALVEPPGPLSSGAGGSWLFVVAVIIGAAAITWVVRTVRGAAPEA
jgi:hypothetical protein